MSNQIGSTGVTIQTVSEILDELKNGTSNYPGMYGIYGSNINLDANSPDGQMINIFAQAKRDMLEFGQQIFSSFDPDQAVGATLDQRCAINNIARKAGTYTQVYVTVTVTQALTLNGQDTTSPFTVVDTSGNQFQLVTSFTFSAAGSSALLFEAVTLGAVAAVAGTLTTISTPQLGVSSVTNASGPSSLGTDEETDAELRLRRTQSTSLPAIGFTASLWSAIMGLTGVSECIVNENTTGSTDSNGIPAHSLWVIVSGGSNADVANAIYLKAGAGCGLKGSTTSTISITDSTTGTLIGTKTIAFDRPTSQVLYVKFSVAAISGSVDVTYIRNQILNNIEYAIGAKADSSAIVAYVKGLLSNATVFSEGVSTDGSTWSNLVSPTGLNYQFSLAAARVIINGSGG